MTMINELLELDVGNCKGIRHNTASRYTALKYFSIIPHLTAIVALLKEQVVCS